MKMDAVLKEFAVPEKNRIITLGNHPCKEFFDLRTTQVKLAKYCGVNEAYMSEMLRGIRFMPPDIETKLNDLRVAMERWEEKNGKRFNS